MEHDKLDGPDGLEVRVPRDQGYTGRAPGAAATATRTRARRRRARRAHRVRLPGTQRGMAWPGGFRVSVALPDLKGRLEDAEVMIQDSGRGMSRASLENAVSATNHPAPILTAIAFINWWEGRGSKASVPGTRPRIRPRLPLSPAQRPNDRLRDDRRLEHGQGYCVPGPGTRGILSFRPSRSWY